MGYELANDLCPRSGEPFDEVLQFLGGGLIQPQHEACAIVARVMGPRLATVVGRRMPAGWKVGTRDLAYGMPYPSRDGRPMDSGSILHLLEEFGFH